MVPGTASVRTVTDNHSHMVEDAAVAALLEGNPVREDLEAANMVGIDFILNVIVDEHQRIVMPLLATWLRPTECSVNALLRAW